METIILYIPLSRTLIYNEEALISTDIIVDLQYGDCAKGKVSHHLCKSNNYSHVLRYNGGCNAGHTIFHKNKKFVTHHIPAGVFFGIKSIIGPGCVLDIEQFFKEIQELEDGGLSLEGMVYVAKNTHIITPEHRKEDSSGGTIGTTGRGNGPAYRDKHARVGVRAESIPELSPYLIDLYEEFHSNDDVNILCEGAQGFGLDIDWGDYPYVTSSHATTAGALLNGIPPSSINNIWGVAKVYETYVGTKEFEPDDPIFEKIREVGDEYGATTSRPRQCNWMDLNLLERAIRINDLTHVVFSKVDVLREVGEWKALLDGNIIDLKSEKGMKDFLTEKLLSWGIQKENIYFSEDKDKI